MITVYKLQNIKYAFLLLDVIRFDVDEFVTLRFGLFPYCVLFIFNIYFTNCNQNLSNIRGNL